MRPASLPAQPTRIECANPAESGSNAAKRIEMMRESGLKPYYQRGVVTLYCGDVLEVLPTLTGINALVTDPPYSSGGQFRGDRTQKTSVKYVQTDSMLTCRQEFSGDNRDQRAFMAWASLWFGYALRAATPGAVACVFTDWRQLPTMTDAIQSGGWVWRNLVTWWKPGIRMQRGRFSSSAEYVVYASHGVPIEGECSPQNVLPVAPVGGDDKDHIAEKPLPLLKTILGITCMDDLVLDPFAGSGTTGAACIQMGRRFVGVEINEAYCEISARRFDAELDKGRLFDAAELEQPKQLELLTP